MPLAAESCEEAWIPVAVRLASEESLLAQSSVLWSYQNSK